MMSWYLGALSTVKGEMRARTSHISVFMDVFMVLGGRCNTAIEGNELVEGFLAAWDGSNNVVGTIKAYSRMYACSHRILRRLTRKKKRKKLK